MQAGNAFKENGFWVCPKEQMKRLHQEELFYWSVKKRFLYGLITAEEFKLAWQKLHSTLEDWEDWLMETVFRGEKSYCSVSRREIKRLEKEALHLLDHIPKKRSNR
ncbi:MAG TPA: hypothetical protein VKP03_00935 [Patescibacteria group bacterium]|nr:hypothetical protein [Patescibacteria group bacterium]